MQIELLLQQNFYVYNKSITYFVVNFLQNNRVMSQLMKNNLNEKCHETNWELNSRIKYLITDLQSYNNLHPHITVVQI